MNHVLERPQVMDATPQYMRPEARFPLQDDKPALERAFTAEALCHDANAGVGDDPEPR